MRKITELGSNFISLAEVRDNTLMVKLNHLPEHIESDIREFAEENNKTIPEDGYLKFSIALDYYLIWNGIQGWTNTIISILCEVKEYKIEIGE